MKRQRLPNLTLMCCFALLLPLLAAVPAQGQHSVMEGVGSDGGLAPATNTTADDLGGVMDGAALAALTGTLLAFAFARVPGLSDWFEHLSGTGRQAMMTLFLLLTALGVLLWNDALSTADWRAWLVTVFAAAAPNQSAHRLVRKLGD